MYKIVHDFEGANIQILSYEETKAEIEVELRDTTEDWFFWCFRVDGAAGKTITFKFPSWNRVGYYGAAVSYDRKTWHWQYDEPLYNGDTFTYTFSETENSVYFAHDMVYRPERFYEFAERHNLQLKTLCMSEKGRPVPYYDSEQGEECILLTARHHACESTGNYVMEGLLEFLIKEYADKFRIVCVPFVDLDGVIDGDQGKARRNHDHNRDYDLSEEPWYNSIRELRRLGKELPIRFAFDLHSPWHLWGENDHLFIPIKNYHQLKNIVRFSNLFEEQNTKDTLPHFAVDDLHPDVSWNKAGSPCFGTYMGLWGSEMSFTLETPYFQSHGIQFSAEKGVQVGRNFGKALKVYLERDVRIEITGDESLKVE